MLYLWVTSENVKNAQNAKKVRKLLLSNIFSSFCLSFFIKVWYCNIGGYCNLGCCIFTCLLLNSTNITL